MAPPNPQAGFARGVYELPGRNAAGIKGDSEVTRKYFITGAEHESDAMAMLGAYIPDPLFGMRSTAPNIDEVNALTGTYIGTAKWRPREAPEPQQERENSFPPPQLVPHKLGDPVRWNCRGQAQVVQIRATAKTAVTMYGPSGDARRDFNGAILVDPDTMQAEGTGRYFVAKEWTAETRVAKSVVTQSFLDGLEALETTTNQNPLACPMFTDGNLITFQALSALYLTHELGEEEDAIVLRFSFLVGKNETSLSVGGIDGITRNAHDFLWPLWEKAEDTNGNVVRQAQQVYVHELYKPTPWTALESILT